MANPWRLLPCIRSFMSGKTQPLLSYSSLKVQLWDGFLLFVLGNMEICKQLPLWQLPLPATCPQHSKRSPPPGKSHIPPEKWKCQPRRINALPDEIPVIAGRQTSWSAGSFPDLCPCGTWNSSSSNHLSITNAYTHTKTTHLQKHIPTNNSECLKINQLGRNMSNRSSYSCISPGKVLRYRQQKRHLNKYKQPAKGHVNGVWPAEITEGGYKGDLEALPAEAGAMLSHFSGRCYLWELLFELSSQMWKPSPSNIQATQVVELLSQNTLHWSLKNDLSLPAPHKTSILLSLSHITAVAVGHPNFWQTLSSKLHIKIQCIKPRYILLEQTVISPCHLYKYFTNWVLFWLFCLSISL